jgi:glycosyltransferase involved in cell wall biosynthesis
MGAAAVAGGVKATGPATPERRRVCIVGPSPRFLSGITYYTFGLCNALNGACVVSAILMRRLLPRFLYPGRGRVGAPLSNIALAPSMPRFEGVDWFCVPSLLQAAWFVIRRRPEVLVLQWWTGTVLHSYLLLAWVARRMGARIVVEFHEALDVGESRLPWARAYVRKLAPRLFRMASAYVAHSQFDARLVTAAYGLPSPTLTVIPHPSYDHHEPPPPPRGRPPGECALLYFGVIRPFKGVEDLIRAFDAIPPTEIGGYRLTIAGETWERHFLPAELAASSRYRDRITFIDRYLTDDEVSELFARADVVVLPYRRCSQSGPLHIAMHYGLPVVVTAVGGLVEAVEGYVGATLAKPGDPLALMHAIRQARERSGRRFPAPRRWEDSARRYLELFEDLVRGPETARRLRQVTAQ